MSKVETMKRSSDSQDQQQTIQSVQQLQAALSSLNEDKLKELIGLLNLTAQELPDQIRQSSKQVLEHYQDEIQKSISLQKMAFDSMTPESMIAQMQPLAEMQAELIAKEISPICQSITTMTQASERLAQHLSKQIKTIDQSLKTLNTALIEMTESTKVNQRNQAQALQQTQTQAQTMKSLVVAQSVGVAIALLLVAAVGVMMAV